MAPQRQAGSYRKTNGGRTVSEKTRFIILAVLLLASIALLLAANNVASNVLFD
jgi:hypothetical protein